jgi:predicted O-methyltransferase YrrM
MPVKPDPLTGKQVINGSYQIATAYSDDVEAVRGNFSEWSKVEIIQGELPGSALKYLANGPSIAFLHVDLNHKTAEISTLEAMWPRLSPGAIILLDDYANKGRDEQWHAHQRFFQNRNLCILTLASGQGLVVVADPSQ